MRNLNGDPFEVPSRGEPVASVPDERSYFPNGRPHNPDLYAKGHEDSSHFVLAGLSLAVERGVLTRERALRYSKGEVPLFDQSETD